MNEIDPARTGRAKDDDPTSIVRVREAKTLLEDITARNRKQPDLPRLSWLQRLLNWIKGA